jgi:pimeloyl-ACP methyl ester carboxylesterase
MMTPLLRRRRSVPAGLNWYDGGTGPALLLLNGWTASGAAWPRDLVRRLGEHFRVIRIDNRGSGWSRATPMPFTMNDLADDAFAVLGRSGVESATVLGFSMGGMIAQALASRHPEVVERLVLVGTSPPAPAAIPADEETTWRLFRRRRPEQPLGEYLTELWDAASGIDPNGSQPPFVGELVEQLMLHPTTRAGAMAQARAAACWHRPRQLRRIHAPTVVVHGRQDILRPVGNGMRLARLIPYAEYVELPEVGHLVPFEAPDVLFDLLTIRRATAHVV